MSVGANGGACFRRLLDERNKARQVAAAEAAEAEAAAAAAAAQAEAGGDAKMPQSSSPTRGKEVRPTSDEDSML